MGLVFVTGVAVGAAVVVVVVPGVAIAGAVGCATGVSGFPRSRSPMLGGSRAIGVQYYERRMC